MASSISLAPARQAGTSRAAAVAETAAGTILRYGLVIILLWLGAFKFTPTEANAIRPLLENSPLLGWLYLLTDVEGASRLIGITEILIALLLAVRPFAPRPSAVGSVGAIAMFLVTLSFLITTPGVWVQVDGFLVLNEAGFFLIKDVFLLGAALWTLSDALRPATAVR
jgi:reactive chlorine resistance protein C